MSLVLIDRTPLKPSQVLRLSGIILNAFAHHIAAFAFVCSLLLFLAFHRLPRFYWGLLEARAMESHVLCSLRYSSGCTVPSYVTQIKASELLRACVPGSVVVFAVTQVEHKMKSLAFWWMAAAFGVVGLGIALLSIY